MFNILHRVEIMCWERKMEDEDEDEEKELVPHDVCLHTCLRGV